MNPIKEYLTKRNIIIVLLIAVGLWLAATLANKIIDLNTQNTKKTKSSSSGSSTTSSSTTTTSSGSSTASSSTSASSQVNRYPLQWGSNTKYVDSNYGAVGNIQQLCINLGSKITKDGIWGEDTEAAVDRLTNIYYKTLFGSKVYPFSKYITRCSNPANSKSKWQITQNDFGSIITWYAANKGKYKYYIG